MLCGFFESCRHIYFLRLTESLIFHLSNKQLFSVETCKKKCTKKKIVMGRCRREAVKDPLKISMGERRFVLGGSAKVPQAASHGVGNQQGLAMLMNLRIKGLELLADA